ncbi:Putative zinc finger protein [Sarcoptes scabiei]|uniref:Putative zinc finger protein n=1 Tax=Sarcoptes scabiei TaxID=52283 RepID=A0A834RFC8_SARSC|nr:Putative zinc finger protein [Sarcoptes scabiei]
MKENRKRRKRSNRKSSESILYQCTWPGCNFKCFQCSIIEQHVRVLHLGREQLINGDGEASKTFTKSSSIHPVGDEDRDDLSDVHEEEFYYNETKLTNGFKEIEIEIDDGGEEEIDEVTNHHSPLTSSTSAVSSLSPMSSSSMNINGNDLQTPSTGTTMTTTTAKMITSQLNLASSKQFVSESINDGPIDLSRSRSSTDSPSTIPKNGINTGKSNLLLVKNDNFALGLPPPPPPQPSATNQSNSMMMSKLMLTSIIPSNMFHRNFSSASPSSMSSSSSSSSSSSAYFSSNSSPTSSTKSWSAHYDLASYKNSDEHSNSNAKISRDLVQYGKKTSTLINGNQIVPTTKPIVVLQHKSSNVIKYGLKSGDNINLINQTSSILSSKKNENSLSKFMNPLDHFDLLNHQSLTLKTSNNSKVPVKVKTNSATKTDRSSSMISNGPRRRGRPPGSTNKKKKLLQPQQLICAMNPLNGTPFIASIAASLSTNVPHQTSCLNLEKSAFHPHPKSFASIDSPSSTSQPNLFGSINNLMVSASSSSIASSSSHQLLMNGSNATLARRPRGESRKCRKVYGMDNRQLWCTQCKWKKACSRFID